MKTITNKLTGIYKEQDNFASYSDLLAVVINRPLKSGVTIKEMRRDMKLIETFETATDTIEITDEDLSYVKALVSNHEWALRHKDLIAFEDDLLAV